MPRTKNPANPTYVEVHLPYHKQGDDLNRFLHDTESHGEALRAHATMLREAAAHLDRIAEIVEAVPADKVGFDADTHHISIRAPSKTCRTLLEQELAILSPEDDVEGKYWSQRLV